MPWAKCIPVRRLLADSRGAVSVEYLMFVAFISLPLTIGLLSLIPRINQHYKKQEQVLYQPYP
jgi:Flp pilus assembly pilin Flp